MEKYMNLVIRTCTGCGEVFIIKYEATEEAQLLALKELRNFSIEHAKKHFEEDYYYFSTIILDLRKGTKKGF